MIPKTITEQHVLQAITEIDRNGIKYPLAKSTKYDLIYNNKPYPPKYTITIANTFANGEELSHTEFQSQEARKYLQSLSDNFIIQTKKNNKVAELINTYKSHIKTNGLDDEIYKWKLLHQYQGRPNLKVINFCEEIKGINYNNLIYHQAKIVMNILAEKRAEEYRNCFKFLLDDDKPLLDRIKYFNEETLKIYRELEPDNKYSHHHDERTIATILTFQNPNEFTFYKDSFYQEYCNLLGIEGKKKGEKYLHYLELIENLITEFIIDDQELIKMIVDLIPSDAFPDSNHRILAQDILFQTLEKQISQKKNYWRIGTTDGKNKYWNLMNENKKICVGWSEVGDLNEFEVNNKQDIEKIFKDKGFYANDNRTLSRKAGELFNFYSNLKIGDVVLAQDGLSVLGIGIISDEYSYEENDTYAHQRGVIWRIEEPNLSNKEGLQTTFYKLSDIELIKKIDDLLNEITTSPLSEMDLIQKSLNQILYGPPGTGKTYNTINYAVSIIERKPLKDNWTREDYDNNKPNYDKYKKDGRIEFITFHQSYAYEEFVEGIKPEVDSETKQIKYEVKPGIFKDLVNRAKADLENNYVLIIDEINRGNISKILGELITLIEDDKRIGGDAALTVTLPYSKETFAIPPNLYIIGTMNTADRSVEALDTALRRRFGFVEYEPKSDLLADIIVEDRNNNINVSELLDRINERIEVLKDRDHRIGHSYFMKLRNNSSRDTLVQIFKDSIIPLLQEYFFSDWGKILLILRNTFIEQKSAKGILKKISDLSIDIVEDYDDKVIYCVKDPTSEGAWNFSHLINNL